MVSVKVEGGAELAARLNAMTIAGEKRILLDVLTEAAEPMRAEAARSVTRGAVAPHIADHFIEEIPRGSKDERTVAVGPAKAFFYGRFLEFGTVKMSARPFLRPAFDRTKDLALRIISRGLWNALRPKSSISPTSGRL